MEYIYLLLLFFAWIYGFAFAHFSLHIIGFVVNVDYWQELKIALIVLYTLIFFGFFNVILIVFYPQY